MSVPVSQSAKQVVIAKRNRFTVRGLPEARGKLSAFTNNESAT